MNKNNNKTISCVDNRKTFASMFGVLAIFFAISAFVLFGQTKAQIQPQFQVQSQLQDIAKQLGDKPSSQEERRAVASALENLTSEEVFLVRKLWRDQLLSDERLTESQAKIFPKLEEFDKYFYQKIEERFGKDKNIFNLSPEQLDQLFNELSDNDSVVKALIRDIENADIFSLQNNFLGVKEASADGGDCDYVASWPTHVNNVWDDYYNARPYSADRVKNDPNEDPCDFRLYINSGNYSEVDGLSYAAWYVVSYHNGLDGSSNRDRYIVGYWSAFFHGVPFEWYLRDYIIFRT